MMRILSTGLAIAIVTLASLAGCNSIAGINEPLDKAGGTSSGASGSSGTTGGTSGGGTSGGGTSGGGTSGAPGDVSRFFGTWTTSTGVQELSSCSLAKRYVNTKNGLALSAPIASDMAPANGLIVTPLNANGQQVDCRLAATVSGEVATLVENDQYCFYADSNSTYFYYAPSTFTLTSATTASVTISATAVFHSLGNTECAFVENAPYAKSP